MRRTPCGLVALVLLAASPALAQEPALVVENGRVITGDGAVLEEASVVVAGDSILRVTQEPVNAPDARRIDASGKTVLPGLIDAHVHLTIPPGNEDSTAVMQYLDQRVPATLQAFLNHGVTTVRSTGDYWPWVARVRDRIERGDLQGARLVTAGPVFTAENAHPATTVCSPENAFCRSHITREVSEPEEARRHVQQLATEGVDYVKFVSDSTNVREGFEPVQIRDKVVQAIIDQAHEEGLKAVGHVAEVRFMERYAGMDIDGFVHPPSVTDANIRSLARTLAKYGTPVTTTLSTALIYSDEPVEPVFDGTSPRRAEIERQAELVSVLAGNGVTIVLGTDWCGCAFADGAAAPIQPGAATVTEMQMLRWGGMSQHAIIQAATSNAARALEMSDRVGTVEPGKLADLIVVDGNPLEDLSALENVEVVVKGGEVVADE